MLKLPIQDAFALAVQHHQAGRLREAGELYHQILAERPGHAPALHFLGVIAHQAGRNELAVDLIRKAIAVDPNLPQAYYNLGIALRTSGRLGEAIAAFRQAAAFDPENAQAHNNLGNALREAGELDAAVAAFRVAVAANPNLPEAHFNLGNSLKDRDLPDQAVGAYREALALKPDYARAHNNLGTVLEELGDFREAERCYRQGIAYDATDALIHANLAKLLGRRLPDKDMAALEALLADASTKIPGRIHLHFGAAKVLDARGNYPQAAEHLRVAHSLNKAETKRMGAGYDPAAHARFISRMIEACPAEFFQRTAGMGLPTPRPVFIFGLPRSGTTLTAQILAAHSQVYAAGELPIGKATFLALAGDSAAGDAIQREDLAFESMGKLDQETVRRIAQRHLLELDRINRSSPRIVDKMPENYHFLGLLAAWFPSAAFIHCRRDLRDVAISTWMTQFMDIHWTDDLEDMTSRFEQYRRLMRHWSTVLDGRWLDCDYEQTVADLPGTARRLVAWCGLEWEPACVDFHLVNRPVRTHASVQVRQPIFTSSVGRWKHYQEVLASVLDRLS